MSKVHLRISADRLQPGFSSQGRRHRAVLPVELSTLLDAATPAAREAAWSSFVDTHSRLLLHVARSVDRDHDAAMDAYAHVLEQFRNDDFKRLRAYASDGRSKFTTWLVVVTRRLCLDLVRRRYGRAQDTSARAVESQTIRRRLVEHIAEAIDADDLEDATGGDAEMRLRTAELERALGAALDSLKPLDRLLLKLRFEDELSAREIAPLLRVPTPFHVYRRLNALLEQLREALSRRGIEESAP